MLLWDRNTLKGSLSDQALLFVIRMRWHIHELPYHPHFEKAGVGLADPLGSRTRPTGRLQEPWLHRMPVCPAACQLSRNVTSAVL